MQAFIDNNNRAIDGWNDNDEITDKEIWDAYVSREVELIKEMKMLPSKNLRLKGLMLAVDFQIKVCQVEQGFSQKIK